LEASKFGHPGRL